MFEFCSHFLLFPSKATFVSTVKCHSENIIVTSVIFGWREMNTRTTVPHADFAALEVPKISNIATIAECVLIDHFTRHTTARLASTSRIVQSVRNTYSVHDRRPMRCHVVMPSIGNVFASWQLTTAVAPYAKRRPKLVNECCQRGRQWHRTSPCNLSPQN